MVKKKQDDSWERNLTGQKVGKYTLTGFIGAGKIGYVYRATRDDFPGPERAVKLRFDSLRQGWDVELKKVRHLELVDGVVHIHDLDAAQITQGNKSHLCQYSVWDYIPPGENLKDYLRRVRLIPISFLQAVVERILHVLHACETEGIHRHGDLHWGNILIGNPSPTKLDDMLQPRAPIYVSDFGYGATGGDKRPKDDYEGLARIINQMIGRIDYAKASATDRHILEAIKSRLGKFLNEPPGVERRSPLDLLHVLNEIKREAQTRSEKPGSVGGIRSGTEVTRVVETSGVGNFQVTEMIGDRWDWWNKLFVPTVPARSKILALDIPTVVTGPRGCGKTMLFRRLSERLIVECGEVANLSMGGRFVAFYVNANDIADAFARFPEKPTAKDEAKIICYANLCILSDLLTVQSARTGQMEIQPTEDLLKSVQSWIIQEKHTPLIEGEDKLELYRSTIEKLKWKFTEDVSKEIFPGYTEMSQHRWLPFFFQRARLFCPWFGERPVLLFIDDYSTPRVTASMQRILNRLFLQRSPYFLTKLSTEASTTFVPEDSSGKNLEDGDDYQLVDIGEESLFLPEAERLAFLNEVFSRRLSLDPRIPKDNTTLRGLLGYMGLSKTEFARRLRTSPISQLPEQQIAITDKSQRRGRSRARVLYWGDDVFSNLWSGDTRTMIQLITDVVDQTSEAVQHSASPKEITMPVAPSLQDRVFRNRGSEWLNAHTRNEPTQPLKVKEELRLMSHIDPHYQLCGEYGDHLKAVVEAFVTAARKLLLGPVYRSKEGNSVREVPRMAFRVEIVDEFRIDGLAREIFRDLIRYGLFIRDSRGKSVRGTFVPRLFLRRLLLPYGALALSKRDSVPLTCKEFKLLLLKPDSFKLNFTDSSHDKEQMLMPFLTLPENAVKDVIDPYYDDLSDGMNKNS